MHETAPGAGENSRRRAILNEVIGNGVREVLQVRSGIALQGCLEGFDIASRMPASLENFELVVMKRQAVLDEMRQGYPESDSPEIRRYWRYCHATAQLEWCAEILKVVQAREIGAVVLPGTTFSARAMLAYHAIQETQIGGIQNPGLN